MNQENQQPVVKPCPFCGEMPIVEVEPPESTDSSAYIECENPNCDCGVNTKLFAPVAAAVAAWNKRADQSAEVDRLWAELKEARERIDWLEGQREVAIQERDNAHAESRELLTETDKLRTENERLKQAIVAKDEALERAVEVANWIEENDRFVDMSDDIKAFESALRNDAGKDFVRRPTEDVLQKIVDQVCEALKVEADAEGDPVIVSLDQERALKIIKEGLGL